VRTFLARAAVSVMAFALGWSLASPAAAGQVTTSERAGSPAIVAVPGSRGATYASPVVVVQPGDELRFVNLELFPHDVRSVEMGPDNTSWCKPADTTRPPHSVRNPRQFPRGKCPLLWTLPITMTVGAVDTKVYGTENLESGTTVEFYCTVFPNMSGTLVVL
jgi:plastocyanin